MMAEQPVNDSDGLHQRLASFSPGTAGQHIAVPVGHRPRDPPVPPSPDAQRITPVLILPLTRQFLRHIVPVISSYDVPT